MLLKAYRNALLAQSPDITVNGPYADPELTGDFFCGYEFPGLEEGKNAEKPVNTIHEIQLHVKINAISPAGMARG